MLWYTLLVVCSSSDFALLLVLFVFFCLNLLLLLFLLLFYLIFLMFSLRSDTLSLPLCAMNVIRTSSDVYRIYENGTIPRINPSEITSTMTSSAKGRSPKSRKVHSLLLESLARMIIGLKNTAATLQHPHSSVFSSHFAANSRSRSPYRLFHTIRLVAGCSRESSSYTKLDTTKRSVSVAKISAFFVRPTLSTDTPLTTTFSRRPSSSSGKRKVVSTTLKH